MDPKPSFSSRAHSALAKFRWVPALALMAAGGISYALPESLNVGPRWLLLVLVLMVPTVVTHQTGRHSWNHFFGIVCNAVVTAALCGSLVLLVGALPTRKEAPVTLLTSA